MYIKFYKIFVKFWLFCLKNLVIDIFRSANVQDIFFDRVVIFMAHDIFDLMTDHEHVFLNDISALSYSSSC